MKLTSQKSQPNLQISPFTTELFASLDLVSNNPTQSLLSQKMTSCNSLLKLNNREENSLKTLKKIFNLTFLSVRFVPTSLTPPHSLTWLSVTAGGASLRTIATVTTAAASIAALGPALLF